MNSKTILTRGAIFIAVLLFSVAAVNAGTIMDMATTDSAASAESVDVETFNPGTILSDSSPDTGSISMSADANGKTILIDLAHQNDISEKDLGPLIRTLSKNGADVEFITREQARGDAFNETLRGADAFIGVSPQEPYTSSQVAGLSAFADGGGRILLAQEPKQMSSGTLVIFGAPDASQPAPMAPLTSKFGLAFGNGYLYNMAENDNNYRTVFASPTETTNLTRNIERVSIQSGTQVVGGTPLLTATEGTAISTTRESGSYSIASTSGNVTAVGDISFLTETDYQDADNEEFAGNLVDFLVSGEKAPGVPKKPAPPGSSTDGNTSTPPRPVP